MRSTLILNTALVHPAMVVELSLSETTAGVPPPLPSLAPPLTKANSLKGSLAV